MCIGCVPWAPAVVFDDRGGKNGYRKLYLAGGSKNDTDQRKNR